MLRQEQDAEFEAALAADRAREERRLQEAAAAEERERAAAEEAAATRCMRAVCAARGLSWAFGPGTDWPAFASYFCERCISM